MILPVRREPGQTLHRLPRRNRHREGTNQPGAFRQSTLIEVLLGVKIFSRVTHGVADYVLVVVFLSAPMALGLTGIPRVLSYALAFSHLLITGFSAFPPGAFPLIPLRIHGMIETGAGVFLIFTPWLFRFSGFSQARVFFPVIGAAIISLAALTNFDRRGTRLPRPPGDRRRWYARKS